MWRATRTHLAALLSLTGILLVTGAGVVHADRPTVINEDNTSFACEYFPEGQPRINVSVNYGVVSGGRAPPSPTCSPRRRAGPCQWLHARRHRKRQGGLGPLPADQRTRIRRG